MEKAGGMLLKNLIKEENHWNFEKGEIVEILEKGGNKGKFSNTHHLPNQIKLKQEKIIERSLNMMNHKKQ
jgi:hypothetical protein